MKLPVGQIVCGDALEVMSGFPAESINCCISSPPYWGLRDYGLEPEIWDGGENCKHKWVEHQTGLQNENRHGLSTGTVAGHKELRGKKTQTASFCSKCGAWLGSLGLEPTFELYIKHLCDIYDEVKRVLRKDGTCWVNLGDTYSKGGLAGSFGNTSIHKRYDGKCANMEQSQSIREIDLPDKSLCCIPNRFRIEMINRGWILRNKIIWSKPNPMPSSAKDRFTVDFEEIMFFVKNSTTLYWIRPDGKMVDKQPDYKAGIEGLDWQWGIRKKKRVKLSLWQGEDYFFEPQYEPYLTESNAERPRMGQGTQTQYRQKRSPNEKIDPSGLACANSLARERNLHPNPLGSNKRTTWIIPTQPTPDAHFATFPKRLVQPMIRAGCPQYVCKKCGNPRVKMYEPTEEYKKLLDSQYKVSKTEENKVAKDTGKFGSASRVETYFNNMPATTRQVIFKGYSDCGCNAEFNRGIVLDPFAGIGTTCTVAERLDRWWIGIDLSEEYCKMARKKMAAVKRNPGLKVFT